MSQPEVQTPQAPNSDLDLAQPRFAEVSPSRRHGTSKLLAIGAAVAVLVGFAMTGTLVVMTKTVTITVDGQSQRVSTLAGSVRGALSAAGLTVADHDTLVPAADQPIADGSGIALNRGRLFTVTIDGSTRQIWTTALTVDEALAQVGQSTGKLSLSANRSREIPLEGLTLTAATLHSVSLGDGGAAPVGHVSAAATVADLLAEKHLTLGIRDTVSPAPDTKLTDGVAVAVTRVVVTFAAESEPIAQPADVTTEDPNLDRGTTTVTVAGASGSTAITYQTTTVNGMQTQKTEVSRVVAVQPVAGQISVGTKTTLTLKGNQVFFNDTEFGVNWDGLAMCESTHNPKAINANPSAGLPTYGLFQFDLPTWASVGGTGNPIDASPEEQIMRAKLLFQSRGLQPWACRKAAK